MTSTDVGVTGGPLGRLPALERATVIATLLEHLPADEAVTALTALSGSRSEALALPRELQQRIHGYLLSAFPNGINVAVLSTLGVASVPTESWLPRLRAELDGMSLEKAAAWVKAQPPHNSGESGTGGCSEPDRYLSLSEAGRRLGVSRQRVRELIDSGKLPAVVRPVLAVRPADVERLAREERRPGRPRKRPSSVA